MKIEVMPSRSKPIGVGILFGCVLLCLLTCITTTAQEENVTWVGGDLYDYAVLSFAVPKEFEDVVEAESLEEGNYSEGRYVVASLLFNDSRIFVLLLYPCDTPQGQLDAAGLRTVIEGFNKGLNQTVYNPALLNISDMPAIWGQLGDQVLIAYQPSVETVSAILIEANVTPAALEYFPESLSITVNDASTPLFPGYCAGLEAAVVPPAQAAAEGAQGVQTQQPVQTEEAVQTGPAFDKEKMEAEMAQAVDMFEAWSGKKLSFKR